jgi:predicted 3-demethylubiquinone-9 3-methyltransferase (glyoxalase superfamily)
MPVTPCLLFHGDAEEAVNFYVSLVPNSRVVETARSGGKPLMLTFELDGTRYMALNGPEAAFTEAVSLMVGCDTQAELDRIWDRIVETGGKPMMCGWIKDRYGLAWQVVPSRTGEWLTGDPAAADRVLKEVMKMVKLDIPTLERAYAGEDADA